MGNPVLFSSVVVKIIEELTDGLIILNQDREVLFFNAALQRMTGWSTGDLLSPESSLVGHLSLRDSGMGEREIVIPDGEERERRFTVSTFPIMGEEGSYTIVRLRSVPEEGPAQRTFREHYRVLFENIDDPLLTADLSGRIIAANAAFYAMLERDQTNPPENVPEVYVYKQALEEKIMRLTSEGVVRNLETHLYTRNRSIRRVLDSSWILRNEHGIIKGYTSQLKDVTYLKNLESKLQISEHNYMMLFDTVITSIMIVDPLGNIVNRNLAAEELYGYSWEEIVGRSYDELFRISESRPTLEEIFRWVDRNAGRYVESNCPRLCETGETKYTYASYSWIKDSMDEVVAYSIMERDFTDRVKLEKKLRDAFVQIKETQSAAILGFARLTEYRDKDTGKHLDRIQNYTKVLAAELRNLSKYRNYITDNYIEDLCLSSVLHDIGKVGIEDAILLKKGRLSKMEFDEIKKHVTIGGEALRSVDREIERESFLTIGKEVAYYHHEWWDGTGYPEGKHGEDIPLSARIVAVADVYDALTTNRPYKKALAHERAVKQIVSESGTHFDTEIVDAFVRRSEDFRRIKMFGEFQEHPESIDDIMRSTFGVDLDESGAEDAGAEDAGAEDAGAEDSGQEESAEKSTRAGSS